MTSATITKKAKATTSKHHPRARITRSEYHSRMYYDVYLYIPADFESDDSDEKDRIRNCWNKNEAKLIPEDYKWSWQVKELHKYHRTLYHIHEMSLAIKTNGENEIMIRLRDAKKYSDVVEYLQELFPDITVEFANDVYYKPNLFAGRVI